MAMRRGRSVHQSCDAEVAPRPMNFCTSTTTTTAGGADVAAGNTCAGPVFETVLLSPEEAKRACCACNSCRYCWGGGATDGDKVPLATSGTGSLIDNAGETAGETAKAAGSTALSSLQPSALMTKPGMAVNSAMDQQCISPSPGSSMSVVGPLPSTITEKPHNSIGSDVGGGIGGAGLYLSMIVCGLSAAAVAAYNGNFLGNPAGLPSGNVNSYYYFLLPAATMVPVLGSLFGNKFGADHGSKPTGSLGSMHGSASESPMRSKTKKSDMNTTAASSTHPSSCTTCLSRKAALRQNIGLVICGAAVGLATLGGLGFLIYRLRNPPPPPVYQRPSFFLGALAVAVVVGIVVMASRQPQKKPPQP